MDNSVLRKKIGAAFRKLRAEGYTCKRSWQCCQNCGWHALSKREAKKAVFYHKQDTDCLRKTGHLYLAWSGDGNLIYRILVQEGLNVEWDGSEHSRFKVTCPNAELVDA